MNEQAALPFPRVGLFVTCLVDLCRPTVGFAAGNLTNLITDGVEGCVVPTGDVGALGTILARLAIDDSWRAAMGVAARRRAETLPTWADAATAFFGAIRGMSAGPG